MRSVGPPSVAPFVSLTSCPLGSGLSLWRRSCWLHRGLSPAPEKTRLGIGHPSYSQSQRDATVCKMVESRQVAPPWNNLSFYDRYVSYLLILWPSCNILEV